MRKNCAVKVKEIERVWMTTNDVMEYLGMERDFVDNLRKSLRIPFYQVGRTVFFRRTDIDTLIENGRVV